MSTHHLTNVALALLIALVLGSAWLLDGPSHQQTDADINADLQAAQAQAQARAHNPCADTPTHCLPAYKRQAAHQVAAK